MKTRQSDLTAFAALAILIGAGCGDAPKQPTADEVLRKLQESQRGGGGRGGCDRVPIEVFLQASPYLNQNIKGQSMPVEVRVLLLTDRETFDQLDFETVWQRGEEAMADHLVSTATVTVFPGKVKIYPMKSKPQVAYVALVAIFRKPKAWDWRMLVDVREQNKRCASPEALHTIVHAVLRDYKIARSETDDEAASGEKSQ